MKKIFLTGASGFIGSQVAKILVDKGYDVYVSLRQSSNLWRIKEILQSLHLCPHDLLAYSEINTYLEQIRPEICIHLAWYAEPGKYLNAVENVDSLSASLNLVSQLARVGCQRFVGIGTCFEYDLSFGYLSESTPTQPQTLYAANKLALCTILEQLAKVTGIEVAWLRLFYLYGPMEDDRRLVPAIISSLLRDEVVKTTKGEQIRDYLHVEDMASAICDVALSQISGIVNIGSGQPITVGEIVSQIGKILGKSDLIDLGALPYRPNDAMFICANNHALRKETDWQPKYNLVNGLEHTISWYKKRT